MRRPRALVPLRHAGFRLLVCGQLSSNVGDLFYAVALPWYVLATHGGALMLGTVMAAYGIPRTVLVIAGGHLSDRFRPWTVMMGTDAVRAVVLAALTAIAAAGPARLGVLLPVAAVLGAAEGLFLPCSMAIVPALLPADELQAGNAITSSGMQLATLLGPILGGAAVALVGSAPAFAIDACSFVISAATLAGIRTRSTAAAAAATASPDDEPAEPRITVAQAIRGSRGVQVALLVTVAANLGSGGLDDVALPALAHGPLAAGAGGYGALIAGFGGGALVGTLLAAQISALRRPAVVGSLIFLLDAVVIGVAPYLGGLVAVVAAMAVAGFCNGFGNVVMITAFLRWAPPHLMGRLSGVLTLAAYGIYPLSVVLGGVIVHAGGPAIFFPLAAAVLGASVGAGLTQRSWRDFGRAAGEAGRETALVTPQIDPPLARG